MSRPRHPIGERSRVGVDRRAASELPLRIEFGPPDSTERLGVARAMSVVLVGS